MTVRLKAEDSFCMASMTRVCVSSLTQSYGNKGSTRYTILIN